MDLEQYKTHIETLSRHELFDESMIQIQEFGGNPKCKILIDEWIKRDGNYNEYNKAFYCCVGWNYSNRPNI